MKRTPHTGINHGDNYCYYYLHIDGQLILKPKSQDPLALEESPFVKQYWVIDLDNRMDGYLLIVEASICGANKESIDTLKYLYKVTDEDCEEFCNRLKLTFKKQDGKFIVTPFVLLANSCNEGSADTLIDAVIDLATKDLKAYLV